MNWINAGAELPVGDVLDSNGNPTKYIVIVKNLELPILATYKAQNQGNIPVSLLSWDLDDFPDTTNLEVTHWCKIPEVKMEIPEIINVIHSPLDCLHLFENLSDAVCSIDARNLVKNIGDDSEFFRTFIQYMESINDILRSGRKYIEEQLTSGKLICECSCDAVYFPTPEHLLSTIRCSACKLPKFLREIPEAHNGDD